MGCIASGSKSAAKAERRAKLSQAKTIGSTRRNFGLIQNDVGPSSEEQHKYAFFLYKIEKLIILHQRKLKITILS